MLVENRLNIHIEYLESEIRKIGKKISIRHKTGMLGESLRRDEAYKKVLENKLVDKKDQLKAGMRY